MGEGNGHSRKKRVGEKPEEISKEMHGRSEEPESEILYTGSGESASSKGRLVEAKSATVCQKMRLTRLQRRVAMGPKPDLSLMLGQISLRQK